MDVLVLIDKLDDVVHNARAVPLTDQVRVDREEIYDLLDQMRATIPEEIKQARWIVKERQEMLAEAKREAERIVREAREQQARLISDEEVTKQAERAADEIVGSRGATKNPSPSSTSSSRSRRGYSRLSSSSFAQRGSGALSCSCSAGSASFRDAPQTAQRPAQSWRQRMRAGIASIAASCAQRRRSSSSPST
jgi:hypothetical protein